MQTRYGTKGVTERERFVADLRAHPVVAQRYDELGDLIGQRLEQATIEGADLTATYEKVGEELLAQIIPLVAALHSLDAGLDNEQPESRGDLAQIYEIVANLCRIDLSANSKPLRLVLQRLQEGEWVSDLRSGLEKAIRTISYTVQEIYEEGKEDIDFDPDTDSVNELLIRLIGDRALGGVLDGDEFRYVRRLAEYWRDPDRGELGLLRRDVSMFCFCVSITCLRKEPDLHINAESFAREHAMEQAFVGEPLAYHFFATALSRESAGGPDLGLGLEYALAAEKAFPRSAGVVHNVATYLNRMAARTQSDQARKELLDRAFHVVNRAISLNPSYPKFYATRARVRIRKNDIENARTDVDIGEGLAAGEVAAGTDREQALVWDNLRREIDNSSDLRRPLEKVAAASEVMEARGRELEEVREDLRESALQVSENLRQMGELREDIAHSRREQIQVVAFVAGAIGIITAGATVASGAGDLSVWSTVGILAAIVLAVLSFLFFATRIVRNS